MEIRVFLLALLLLASPFLQVARCQSEAQDEGTATADDSGDLEIVNENDETPIFDGEGFDPATGVETVFVFPNNIAKCMFSWCPPVKRQSSSLASNMMVFNRASVPPSAQATFPYIFAVSKFLQPGSFDLVGQIVYEIEQQPYQSTFFNGTIEVVEPSGVVSVETLFLVSLGFSLLVALGLWIVGLIQRFSKQQKSKRAPKVEVGTRSTDASLDEWLKGTAYTQSVSNKSKKKK